MVNLYSGWEGRVKPVVSGVLTPGRGGLAPIAGETGPLEPGRAWGALPGLHSVVKVKTP
jgi:hypothetical protein